MSFGHNHNLGNGFYTRLDYNQVSDDTYFRDLGNSLNLLPESICLQQGACGVQPHLGEDGTLNVTLTRYSSSRLSRIRLRPLPLLTSACHKFTVDRE